METILEAMPMNQPTGAHFTFVAGPRYTIADIFVGKCASPCLSFV